MLTFAAGLGAGFALFKVPPPESLSGSEGPSSVPATLRQFDDVRNLTLEVTLGKPSMLSSPLAGRITSVADLHGSLASGQRVAEVSGQPIVALATSVPLWRDLPSDAKGADVAALQTELQRLGKELEVTGMMDRATRRAAAELLGVHDPDAKLWATIPVANWLWIPAPQIAIEEVEVEVGQSIGTDTAVVSVPGEDPMAKLASVPADGLPGPRIITIAGTSYPVDESGQIVDRALIQQLIESPQFEVAKQQVEAGQPVTLRVPWTLGTPVDVYAVPPQALFGAVGSDACVEVDGAAVPVQIVTSELGRALVTSQTSLSAVSAKPSVSCPSS
ncbi:MAG: hypothetical protein Q4G35_02400 [Propionibacteriaceae bacterium]|nr:hypothetical protein [Propionibacteriaceae bacterium]